LSMVWVPKPKPIASAPPAKANTVKGIFTETRLKTIKQATSKTRSHS